VSSALNLDSHGTSGAPKSQVRVLVTGASGKIGKHVVAELVARGYTVQALTTKPVEAVADLQHKVEFCGSASWSGINANRENAALEC
jgi:nucleoside-diphosphate-sugar epimerase